MSGRFRASLTPTQITNRIVYFFVFISSQVIEYGRHTMQLSWPYPDGPQVGVWGPTTSNHK
jgi:hypothetical protein